MELTASEREILIFLREYIKENGISPSIREIGDNTSWNSISGVHRTIKSLEHKGYIVKAKRKSRSIRIKDSVEGLIK